MESSESMVSEQPETQGSVEVDSCEFELFIKSGNLYAQLSTVKSDQTELTIPATVEKDGSDYPVQGIAPRALRQSHVESLNFAPNSQVKSLKKDALYCHTLKKVVLPASLETLEIGWCNFTLKLVDLTVEDGNEHFVTHDNALYDTEKTTLYHVARNIKEFTVPASVQTIGSYAFEQCRRLRTLSFEDGSQLQKIEQWAFSHCGLKQVTFPDSLESIGYDAFFHTPRLEEITFGQDSVLKNVLIGAFKDTSLSNVTLPPSTIKIGIAAFQNCPKLEKVTLLNPNTVTIWRDAFTGTTEDFKLVVAETTRLKGAGVPANVERGEPGESLHEIAQNAIEGLVQPQADEEQPPAEPEPQAEGEAPAAEEEAQPENAAPAEGEEQHSDHPAEGLLNNVAGMLGAVDNEEAKEEQLSEAHENEENEKLSETPKEEGNE